MAVIIDGQTASFNKAMAQSQSQLKSFTSGIQSVGAALGITFGAVALFNGLKAAVGIMSEFEHTMSQVKAITGATGKEFEKLQKEALRLGAATKFSATEVGQLQIAYGRLGFNTKEILDATEATLDLAAATGEDLAKAADVAGSTVRGFGLEARETQRVVDVMAKSFNTTALGLENFTEAMKYVAPVAAAAGLSVEETTALLGTLADAGIRGSMAGTSLRKIFTDLPKDGRPFQERLAELAKKGINVADAMDEVGRTAQTSLLILAKNNDKTRELAASFQDVAGEAAKMARTMQDDLQGDVEKLTGAWEGLILSLGKTGAIRDATQAITGFLSALSGEAGDPIDAFKALAQGIKDGLSESEPAFKSFLDRIKEIRRESGKPVDINIVSEIAEKYKLTEEQANTLYRAILDVNKALSFQEKVIKEFKGSNLVATYGETTQALDLYKQGIYDLILAEQIQKAQIEKLITTDNAAIFQPQIDAIDKTIRSQRAAIEILNVYSEAFVKSESKIQAATAATIVNLKFYQDGLKKVNDAFESLALTQDASGQFTEKTLSNLRILSAESAGLENFIGRVNRLKESFKNFDFVIKPPDTSKLNEIFDTATGKLKEFKNEFGTLTHTSTIMEEVTARVEASMKKLTTVTKTTTDEVKKHFIDLGGPIGSALSGIGEALGNAAAGVGNFGQDIIRVVAGFAKQLGEILIATAIGALALKRFAIAHPVAAIAAGVALVALATAAGAAASKAHSSSLGGGSSGGLSQSSTTNTRSISASATDAQDVNVTGQTVIRGQDLYVIFSNYQNNNKFTKANG